MDRILDYVKWIGELDFAAYPFREADALVLCSISYFDLTPVLPEASSRAPVSDCLEMITSGKARQLITGGDQGNLAIFEAAARSRRYGRLVMAENTDILREDPALQFTAVTFFDGDRAAFIAFRGTDASLAGWKEDCMIAFTETEAQKMAADYAARIFSRTACPIRITGHSKGANLALYAACRLDEAALARLERLYMLDGPGFCPEVLDTELIRRVDAKTVRIIPEFDVIGKFFEPKITDTRIVKSSLNGFMQHAHSSWMLDHGDLALCEKNNPRSVWLSEVINEWIAAISQENRPVFIDELFDALGADGKSSLDDMTVDSVQEALIRFSKTSELTRLTLADFPRRALFEDALPEENWKQSRDLLSWFKKNQTAQAVLLFLAGAFFLFLSGTALGLLSLIVFLSLTLLQCGLTLRRLIKMGWQFKRLTDRLILSLLSIVLSLALLIKEKALFLVGSLLCGTLFLSAAYGTCRRAANEKDPFWKVLFWAETAVSLVAGIGFLMVPEDRVFWFTGLVGIAMLLDSLARLVNRWLIRH